jgi:hypothetical protein
MPKVIDLYDLDANIVTIDVPHGDALTTIATALGRWQADVQRLNASMDALQSRGVYLDPDGAAVVPGWSERKKNGRHVAWYLVWPRSYARLTGCPRRQYVRANLVEATREKVKRTLEYANLAAWRARVLRQRDQVGQELDKLIEKHGLAPVIPPWRDDDDDARPDDEMVTNLAAPGGILVTSSGLPSAYE